MLIFVEENNDSGAWMMVMITEQFRWRKLVGFEEKRG
jgi:hypothetical protein